MNVEDEAALALWQINRGQTPMNQEAIDRMESMLAEFYGRPTSNEYERIMSCVTEIFSAKPIFTSDLPCHLSEAL
jgi:hypothetical protein